MPDELGKQRPSDDPKKKLLRCLCGNAEIFTALVKCVRCGAILCNECRVVFRARPHCKLCRKERQREENVRPEER